MNEGTSAMATAAIRKPRPSARASAPVPPRASAAAAPAPIDSSASEKRARSNTSLQQPSVRAARTWTPQLVKTAERTADSGNMQMLGELCDQLLADERIRKAYETTVGGLLSLDLTFEAAGDGRRRGRAVKALEADEDWWAAFPESELQQFLTAGRLAGVSWGQLRWQAHLTRIVPRLEPWDIRHFRYDWQKRQWFVRTDTGSELPVNAGDGQWIAYMPYGSYRPWAYGQWRGLSRWWLLKGYAISDWGRTGAVGAALVATPRESNDLETNASQRKKLSDDMYALSQAGGVIVLPNGFEMKVVEQMANTARNYNGQIEASNTAIDIAIQGQNLTSEVQGGSHAAASVHERVEDRVIRNVSSTAATCLHDQALTHWAQFNFGASTIAPWPLWDTEPPEDTKAEADGQKAFGDAMKAVQDAGFEVVNAAEIAEKHGLKIKVKPKEDLPPDPVPDPNDPNAPKPPAKVPPKKGALAHGGFHAVLASGAPVSENPGFVAGQLYADAIVEFAKKKADAALEPTITAIGEALKAATSYEDLRERLKVLAPELDATEVNELVYRVMALGEFTGRHAVTADA
jgi:hypothetical protein